MRTEELTIKRDGLTLRGYKTLPESGEYDVCVLLHGVFQDCGRSDNVIKAVKEHLTSLGIGTVGVDFNGEGQSDGTITEMNVLGEILDAGKVIEYARKLPGVRRVFLYGHSQGGVVASMTAGVYHDVIDRLILTSAAATLKEDALGGGMMGVSYDPEHIPETIDVRGTQVGGIYLRTNQMLPIYEWASRYQGPVCIIHCTKDAIVPVRAAEGFKEAFAKGELHILEGGNHSVQGDDVRPAALDLITEFVQR